MLEAMILVESNVDMEVKRNVGYEPCTLTLHPNPAPSPCTLHPIRYFMALVSEQQQYHENIAKRGGLQVGEGKGEGEGSLLVCWLVGWLLVDRFVV